MRMWMIDPKLMCDQHLLGEHGELHKFIPSFHKKYKVTNRVSPVVQIELSSYQERHDELAEEMLSRENSIKDLRIRCRRCKYVMDRKIQTE